MRLSSLLLTLLLALPAAPVLASDDAETVLRFFNTPWLVRWGMEEGARTMEAENAEQARFTRKVIADFYDEEEIMVRLGDVLDDHVAGADLAKLAAFSRTPSGREAAAAMHGRDPDQMAGALASLSPRASRDMEALVEEINRISAAMALPVFREEGERYGIELGCRLLTRDFPERMSDPGVQRMCGGRGDAVPAAPRKPGAGSKRT